MEAKKGKNYLLAIGIDSYNNLPNLNNAVKDVKDFSSVLIKKYRFEDDKVTILINEEATYNNIIGEFKKLVKKVTSKDNLLVYYAGHGGYDDVFEEGFWMPCEGAINNEHHYLRNSVIHKAISKIDSFHTFLISDACYSGSFFQEGNSRFYDDAYNFRSRWGLTSGRNTVVSDGKIGSNSPFARSIIEVLSKSTQPINVSLLCDIVKQSVAATTNSAQLPSGDPLMISGHEGGQFLFQPINKHKTQVNTVIADFRQLIKNEDIKNLKLMREVLNTEISRMERELRRSKTNKELRVGMKAEIIGGALTGLIGEISEFKEENMVSFKLENMGYQLMMNIDTRLLKPTKNE